MRNVFDQYSQPENRLTHALMVSLDADRWLLKDFIRWARAGRPSGRLAVLEQSIPDAAVAAADFINEVEFERRGLPDGWIHDNAGWALLIESKVAAGPSRDQVRRHLRTAARQGFEKPRLLWLTVTPVSGQAPDDVVNRTWSELYEWLSHRAQRSRWARRAAEYFEVAEVQADMKEHLKKGTLTRFAGIPFGAEQPYSYVQAKRILGLLRDELRQRRDLERTIGMNRRCPGRGAITGRAADRVWDFISTKAAAGDDIFTQNMHLTLGITEERLEAFVTVPNGIRSRLRAAMLGPEYENFHCLVEAVVSRLDKVLKRYRGASPEIVVVQRRYHTQRAEPRHDAVLRFDPRTAIPLKPHHGERPVLNQPQWLIAAYDALKHRRANLQLQIGAVFPYEKAPIVGRREVVEAVAQAWLACEPVVKALNAGRNKGPHGRKRRIGARV